MTELVWCVLALVAIGAALWALDAIVIPLVAYVVSRPFVGVVWLARTGWARATHRRAV
jgi:hypothetical protein